MGRRGRAAGGEKGGHGVRGARRQGPGLTQPWHHQGGGIPRRENQLRAAREGKEGAGGFPAVGQGAGVPGDGALEAADHPEVGDAVVRRPPESGRGSRGGRFLYLNLLFFSA